MNECRTARSLQSLLSYPQPNTPPEHSKPPQLEPSRPHAYSVHRAAPVPLATRPPPKLLALPSPSSHATIEELELRVKKANDEFRNDVMQSLRTLTEELTMAITSRPSVSQPLLAPLDHLANFHFQAKVTSANLSHSAMLMVSSSHPGPLVHRREPTLILCFRDSSLNR